MSRHSTAESSSATRTIGDILLARGFVSHEKLQEALERQQHSGKPLGQILVEEGAISRLELASALAEQWSDIGSVSPEFGAGTEPQGTNAPLVELQELRNSRRVLEERLRAFEEHPMSGEDVVERERLAARLAGVEAAVAGLQEHDAAREVPKLRQLVEQLTARQDEIADSITRLAEARATTDRVDDVERRLAALGAAVEKAFREMERRADESDEALATLVADVQAGPLASVDELTRRVAALEPRLDDVAGSDRVAALESAVHRLGQGVSEQLDRSSDIEALRDRLGALAADAGGVAALREQAAVLAARLDEVAARPASDPGLAATVDELAARVDALSSRPIADGETDSRVAEMGVRLDRLAAAVDGLGARPAPDTVPAAWVDELAARVAELAARPAVDPDVVARLETLTSTVAELGSHADDVHELRAGLDALAGRVDAVADTPIADPRVEQAVADVIARLGHVERHVDGVAPLGALVGTLTDRLDRLEQLHADRSSQVDDLAVLARAATESAHAQSGAAVGELAERLAALERDAARLGDAVERAAEEAASRTGELDARLAEVTSRLHEPGPAPAPVSVSDALASGGAARAAGDDQDVERLRMVVERLMLDFAEHRRAVSAALSSREFTALLEELAARVDELQAGGVVGAPAGNGGSGPRADVRALTSRLDEVEESVRASRDGVFQRLERMMGTIDWRLQRLEHPEAIDDGD